MRMNIVSRLLILMLALLMPAVEYVAVRCTAVERSHHERDAAPHAMHSRSSHDSSGQTAPAQSPSECPMKVPCTAPALQVAFIVELPVLLEAEAGVDEPSAAPLSIEHTSLTPPPRHSA